MATKKTIPLPPLAKDLTGNVFEHLTVVSYAGSRKHGHKNPGSHWLCCCQCGKTVVLLASALTSGNTRSCGCLRAEANLARCGKHHESRRGQWTAEYRAWLAMHRRCDTPSKSKAWSRYGGRGIKVCERWRQFENFLADMGRKPSPRHSLGRIDGDSDYEPSNCTWQTQTEQMNSTRRNRLLTFQGETLNVSQWAKKIGITWGSLKHRLQRGWTIEKALTTPKDGSRK